MTWNDGDGMLYRGENGRGNMCRSGSGLMRDIRIGFSDHHGPLPEGVDLKEQED